jgi:hypothetical protein
MVTRNVDASRSHSITSAKLGEQKMSVIKSEADPIKANSAVGFLRANNTTFLGTVDSSGSLMAEMLTI